jgi:hypothetical protein
MAWWDHEELKAPADRSDRYVLAFPSEYSAERVIEAIRHIYGGDKPVKILEERKKTHGEYTEHARCTQAIMRAVQAERNWDDLPDPIRETVHMIAHKLGRIAVGNPYVHDHYLDIEGYAHLIVERTEDGVGMKRT